AGTARDAESPAAELGLRNIGEPFGRGPRGTAEDLDGALERGQQPGDGLEQRALARSVRPDDRQQRAPRDLQVDVRQGNAVAVAGRHVMEGDRRGRDLDHLSDWTIWSAFHAIILRYVSLGGGPTVSLYRVVTTFVMPASCARVCASLALNWASEKTAFTCAALTLATSSASCDALGSWPTLG